MIGILQTKYQSLNKFSMEEHIIHKGCDHSQNYSEIINRCKESNKRYFELNVFKGIPNKTYLLCELF